MMDDVLDVTKEKNQLEGYINNLKNKI